MIFRSKKIIFSSPKNKSRLKAISANNGQKFELKSSRNKKDLNDVTVALVFGVFFSAASRKKPLKMGQL